MMSLGMLFAVGHSLQDALARAAAGEASSAETNATRDEQDAQLPIAWVDPSAAEKEIVGALQSRVTLDFQNAPLQDVVDYLENLVDIQVHCDVSAMEDAGLDPGQTAVTIELENVRLQGVLELMLDPLDLAWTVRHEVLTITSKERAAKLLAKKVYDVTELVEYRDASGKAGVDFNSLIRTLTTTIDPSGWNTVGGPASIAPTTAGRAYLLVISQQFPVHLEISEMLARLRNAAEEHPGDGIPPVRASGGIDGRTGAWGGFGGQGFGPGFIRSGNSGQPAGSRRPNR
jgi:hypothetical protein